MSQVTTTELKAQLQQICNASTEIADVLYYQTTGQNGKTISKIVVVHIHHYESLNNDIFVTSFTTVEKALVHFMDTSSYTIVNNLARVNANILLP